MEAEEEQEGARRRSERRAADPAPTASVLALQ